MAIHPLPQQPLATVLEDRLVIDHLEIDQPDVVLGARRYLQTVDSDEASDYVVAALEVGAKALAVASSTVDVEEIRRAMGDLTTQVTSATQASIKQIKDTVDLVADGENGTIVRSVSDALGGLQTEITALVAGEEAPVRMAVAKSVAEVTDRALGEVQRALTAQSEAVRQLLNSDDPTSPLNALRLEVVRTVAEQAQVLQTQLQEVKTLFEVSAAVQETMKRSTAKGGVYEDDVAGVLDQLTKASGDLFERTGTVSGLKGRAKKGDVVITLSELVARTHTIRIVAEAKDQPMSLNAWKQELDAARKNRGAVAALGIVKDVNQMPGHDRLRVIDPLTFVVVFDPARDDNDLLVAAYQLLRTQAACVVLETDGDVDVAALRSELTKAIGLLGQVDKITKAAEQAKTQASTISSTASSLREDLTNSLQRALRMLDGADAGGRPVRWCRSA